MSFKKIFLTLVAAIFALSLVQAQQFKYIGAPKCKMCHQKPDKGQQYQVWEKGPHANALKTLSSPEALAIAKEKGISDPAKDPGCLKCHTTTGHIEAGEMAGIKPTEGVSCESCHGPGSRYKGASIMKSREQSMKNGLILPTEDVCKQCHNEESPTYKPFNYAEKVKVISHDDPTTE